MEAQPDTLILSKEESEFNDLLNARNSHIGCVLNVLQMAGRRFKISLMLPKLLKNPDKTKRALVGTQHESAIALVDNYINRRDFIVKKRISPLLDHGMIRLIDYFQMNDEISSLFPNLFDNMSTEENDLLNIFENLCNICKLHLLRGGKSHINYEQRMYKVYQENESLKRNIEDYLARMSAKRLSDSRKRALRTSYLKRCQQRFDQRKEDNEIKMRNEGYKLQRIIHENQKNLFDKQIVLEEKLKGLQSALAKEEALYKKKDSKQKEAKSKVQYQLAAIIKLYDSTIKEKMIRVMDIDEEISAANSDLHELTKIYDEEYAIYEEVVLKYERQGHDSQQNRVLQFMMNFAARKIQRYWRKWRRHLNKKLRQEERLHKKFMKTKISRK